VAAIADTISRNNELASDYTSKWNNVAIVCDGTRVLGIGNIGPQGALPVMEGKSELFKILGDINAYPMCINTTDKEEIIGFVKAVEPTFGAINIEAIDSPKVVESYILPPIDGPRILATVSDRLREVIRFHVGDK
jgi:malate dehydrogenase (oxaloacetate-decarboxylating)